MAIKEFKKFEDTKDSPDNGEVFGGVNENLKSGGEENVWPEEETTGKMVPGDIPEQKQAGNFSNTVLPPDKAKKLFERLKTITPAPGKSKQTKEEKLKKIDQEYNEDEINNILSDIWEGINLNLKLFKKKDLSPEEIEYINAIIKKNISLLADKAYVEPSKKKIVREVIKNLEEHRKRIEEQSETEEKVGDFLEDEKKPLSAKEKTDYFLDIKNRVETNLELDSHIKLEDWEWEYIVKIIGEKIDSLNVLEDEKKNKEKIISDITNAVLNDYYEYSVNKIITEAKKIKENREPQTEEIKYSSEDVDKITDGIKTSEEAELFLNKLLTGNLVFKLPNNSSQDEYLKGLIAKIEVLRDTLKEKELRAVEEKTVGSEPAPELTIEKEKNPEELLNEKRTSYAEAYKNFDKNKYKKFVGDNTLSVEKINNALKRARENILAGDYEMLKNGDKNIDQSAEERKSKFIKKLTEVGLNEKICEEMYNVEAAKVEYNDEKQKFIEEFKLKKRKGLIEELEKKHGLKYDGWEKDGIEENELKKQLQTELYQELVKEYGNLKEAKIENMPPKEKGRIRKITDWYLKQKRWKRIVASTIVMTGAMYGIAWAQGLMSTAVFASKGLIRGGRAAGGAGLGMIAGGAVEKRERKKIEKKYNEAIEKLKEEFTGDTKGFDKEYKRIEDEKSRDERILLCKKMAIMFAAGASATAISGLFEPAIAGGIKDATDYFKGGDQHEGTLSEDATPNATVKPHINKPITPEELGDESAAKAAASAKEKAEIKFNYEPKRPEYKLNYSDKPGADAIEQPTPEASRQVETAAPVKAAAIEPGAEVETPKPTAVAEIEIKGETDTLSEAVEKALKKDGVSNETRDNFIRHWLGDKTEINDETRNELLNKSIRKLSVANIKMGDGDDIENLVYEGNKVRLNSDGSVEVIKAGGIKEAAAVSEGQLRQNAEALKPKSASETTETSAKAPAPDNLPVPEETAEIPTTKSEVAFSELDPQAQEEIIKNNLLKEYNTSAISYNKVSHLRPDDFTKLDGTPGNNAQHGLDENFEQKDINELQEKVKEVYKTLSPEEKQMSVEELIKNNYNKFFPGENNLKAPEAETNIGAEAAPEQSAETIAKENFGELHYETEGIREAILENNPEYFTGLNLGEIIDAEKNYPKGIIKIEYPAGHPLKELTIDLREKSFIIDDHKELLRHSWKYGRHIDSMEKLKNFVNEELVKKIALDNL